MKFRPVVALALFYYFSAPHVGGNDGPLLGGFAKINTTPIKPVTLSGYANRTDLSNGIHDSMSARISVRQSGENKLVLISTDIIGYYGGTAGIFRKTLLEKFSLQPDDLFLSAVHTHAAPSLMLDENHGHPNNVEYTKLLLRKLEQAFIQYPTLEDTYL